jgi:hypothetical protein
LRALGTEKMQAHRQQFVGQTLPAITLHTPAEVAGRARTAALTDNFLPVEIEGVHAANRLVDILVTGLNAQCGLQATALAASSVHSL